MIQNIIRCMLQRGCCAKQEKKRCAPPQCRLNMSTRPSSRSFAWCQRRQLYIYPTRPFRLPAIKNSCFCSYGDCRRVYFVDFSVMRHNFPSVKRKQRQKKRCRQVVVKIRRYSKTDHFLSRCVLPRYVFCTSYRGVFCRQNDPLFVISRQTAKVCERGTPSRVLFSGGREFPYPMYI